MILKAPFYISSRLLPAIKIGGKEICADSDGTFYIDDYKDKIGNCRSTKRAFDSLFSFLLAVAEAYRYKMAIGYCSDYINLFPDDIIEWAYQNDMEIQLAQLDIDDCLTEK